MGFQRAIAYIAGTEAYKRCRSECPTSCTQYFYTWQDDTGKYADRLADDELMDRMKAANKTASRLLSTPGFVADFHVEMFATSPNAVVIRDKLGYGFHQYFCELGGTWGLFLGLSFVNLMNLALKLCRRQNV
jgi:hypothetical protein